MIKKLETPHRREEFETKPFWISSSEFFDIIEESIGDRDVSVKTGTFDQKERLIMEGLDDLRANIDKLESPFELEIASVKMTIDRYGCRIQCRVEDQTLATSIVNKLNHYQTCWRAFLHSKITYAAVPFSVFFIITLANLENFHVLLLGASAAGVLPIACLFIAVNSARCTVKYVRRDNFYQRNKDRIIVGIIMALVGASASLVVPHFSSKLSDQVKQIREE